MARIRQTPFPDDLPRMWYQRLMARSFGQVREDNRPGRKSSVYIDCRIDEKRFKLLGPRTRSGHVITFGSVATATEVLNDIRADLRSGASPLQACAMYLPSNAGEVTVRAHYKRFLEAKERQGQGNRRERQLSEQRLICLRGHLTQGHIDLLLDLSIFAITTGDLDDWRDHLFETTELSANSIKHISDDLRTFFRWLKRRGDISEAPEKPAIVVAEYVAKIPTREQVDRLLTAIPWELRGLFMCRGLMGLRPSEARRADLADWRFGDNDTLRVHGKAGRGRIVPAHPDVSRWVREHHPVRNIHDADKPVVLFQNPNSTAEGRRWSSASERRVFAKAMRDTGLKFRHNEALRHAFGTELLNRLLRDGHSRFDAFRLLMAVMGHTEVKTSMRYAKFATESMIDLVEGR